MTRSQTRPDAQARRRGLATRFAHDTRGGFATMLAVAAVPLIGMAGIGVDVARVLSARNDLQAATDNSALALARQPVTGQSVNPSASGGCPGGGGSPTDFQTQACNWVLTNFNRSDVSNLVISPTATSTQVTVAGTGDVTTTLAGILGVRTIHIAVSSVVNRNIVHVELALVLDNTGSMLESDNSGSTKSAALKSASSSLIDTLAQSAAGSGEPNAFRVAMVPFATYVNIKNLAPNLDPTSLSTYPIWMPGTSDYARDIFPLATNRYTLLSKIKASWAGCVESRPMPYDVNDTAPSITTAGTRFVPFLAPDEPDFLYTQASGNPDLYVNNYLNDPATLQTSTDWYARQSDISKYLANSTHPIRTNAWGVSNSDNGPNKGCPGVYAQPLTTNYAGVKSAISALAPDGNTHIPFGLAWGWYMLSPNMPFTTADPYTTKTTYKIAILVTDGANTYGTPQPNVYCNNYNNGAPYQVISNCPSPSSAYGSVGDNSQITGYGYVWQNRIAQNGSSSNDIGTGATNNPATAMNDRLVHLCHNMQVAGVILYTIPLQVTDPNTKTMLQNCASPSNVGPPGTKYLEAQSGSQLTAAFANIAGQISALRVAQ